MAVARMSALTYDEPGHEKPVVWLAGGIHSPPFSPAARQLAGVLLRRVQRGQRLAMPYSRPLPVIGARCHELRLGDADNQWRVFYHVSSTAIVVLEVTTKKTPHTPQRVIDGCRRRLALYLLSEREGGTA
jgi:phage-related protein